MCDVINLHRDTCMPTSIQFEHIYTNWLVTTSAFVSKPRSWTMEKLAESICTFDNILSLSSQAVDKIAVKFPLVIITFRSFMINVYKEAEIETAENLISTRVKLGK